MDLNSFLIFIFYPVDDTMVDILGNRQLRQQEPAPIILHRH